MTVDTKRLRELAEAVLSSKPGFCGENWRTHYDYEKAANPQAIIALLDELEEAERENVRLTRGLVQIQHILRSRHLSDGEMCLAALSEATSTIIKLDEKIEGEP